MILDHGNISLSIDDKRANSFPYPAILQNASSHLPPNGGEFLSLLLHHSNRYFHVVEWKGGHQDYCYYWNFMTSLGII